MGQLLTHALNFIRYRIGDWDDRYYEAIDNYVNEMESKIEAYERELEEHVTRAELGAEDEVKKGQLGVTVEAAEAWAGHLLPILRGETRKAAFLGDKQERVAKAIEARVARSQELEAMIASMPLGAKELEDIETTAGFREMLNRPSADIHRQSENTLKLLAWVRKVTGLKT